jgi:hypothetical protein
MTLEEEMVALWRGALVEGRRKEKVETRNWKSGKEARVREVPPLRAGDDADGQVKRRAPALRSRQESGSSIGPVDPSGTQKTRMTVREAGAGSLRRPPLQLRGQSVIAG